MQMEYRRILCAYLAHTPNHIREHNRQVLNALLANCYSTEDLARDIVASINRQIRCIIDEERSGLNAEDVVNYWYEVAAASLSPSATSVSFFATAQGYHASSTPRRSNHFGSSFGSQTSSAGASSSGHPTPEPHSTARHHENPNVDRILSQAYNDVTFAWTTDFLLYPIGKRVHQLLPRIRGPPQRPGLGAKAVPNTHHSVQSTASAKTSTIANGAASGASGAVAGTVAGAAEATRVQGGQSALSVPVPASDVLVGSEDVERPTKRRRLDDALMQNSSELPSSNKLEQFSTLSMMVRDSEEYPGLEGCKYINDLRGDDGTTRNVKPGQPTLHHRAQSDGDLDTIMTDATETFESYKDEIGEALYYRAGKDKEQLKQDIMRRDGPTCAASREHGPLFCTQIIPESNDLDRFVRFRKMVSTYFSGYYDEILEPSSNPSSASSPSSSSTTGVTGAARPVEHAVGSVSVNAGLGSSVSSPSNQAPEYRPRRRGHYPSSTNILQSPRNAINLSAKWLKWFDEGKIVLQESGGRYYVKCLDPVLYRDPSFSRPGPYSGGGREVGHGLELDVGATVHRRTTNMTIIPGSSSTTTGVSLPPIMVSLSQVTPSLDVSLPPIVTSLNPLKQLPTPMATPPISSDAVLPSNSVTGMAVANSQTQPARGAGLGVGPAHRGRSLWTIRARPGRGDSSKANPPNRPSPLSPSSHSDKADGETKRGHRTHQNQNASPSSFAIVSTAANITGPSIFTGMGAPIAAGHASTASTANNTTKITRVPGPFASGVAARQTYAHSRNSSGSSTSSKHSLSSLLNPSISTPNATSESSTPSAAPTTPTLASTPTTSMSTSFPSSIAAASSSTSDSASVASASESVKAESIRRELWEVDTLDPNLVRLHEQIVSTWWATNLAQQLGNQMGWVDSLPLEEMNIFSQGPQTFSDLLMHKLRLL